MVSADTADKRREFERLVVQTFPANELTTPQELNEVANSIRVLLDLPQVQISTAQKSITVRGPASKVRVAQHIINTLAVGAPEAFLEVEVLEVHSRRARELGLLAPLQSSLVKLTSDQSKVQTGVAAPLNQVFGREAPTAGTAINQGMAAFGGGRSAFAITVPGASFRATLSESLVRGISTQSVRAVDNLPATLLIGERYPIVNATFSPIFFAGDVQQQAQQGTLVNPFPSFTFEDIGIRLKMTPRIHNDGEISLKLEAQVRSLTGQTFNSVPTISNRQTEQVVRVRDGQAALISGVLLQDERSSMNGWPLLAEIPVLGYLFGQRTREVSESEVIVVVTPHILHDPAGAWPGKTSINMPSLYLPVAEP
jgi:general secretion pathway protein D